MGFWYRKVTWAWLLFPFALLFRLITRVRYLCYKANLFKSYRSKLPVIIVGNISVGGNGKTPFVIWLCDELIKQGYHPAVISRGYGGKSDRYPLLISKDTTGGEAGDEPILIYKRLGIPVVVDPKRVNAIKYLESYHSTNSGLEPIDIIISDDGLQHYAIDRDIEIVIVDGERRFGNQCMMPIGPLREPITRLKNVDFVVNNGKTAPLEHTMQLEPKSCVKVDGSQGVLAFPIHADQSDPSNGVTDDDENKLTDEDTSKPNQTVDNEHSPSLENTINACAAIGYPQRFFNTLTAQGFKLNQSVSFADHHPFKDLDFQQFEADMPLLMTEKDAVKCRVFAKENWWYLPISATLSETFKKVLFQKIKCASTLKHHKKTVNNHVTE